MLLAPHPVSLRATTPTDEVLVRRLFADSRAADFAHLPAADATVQTLIDLQFAAQNAMFASRHPAAVQEIISDHDTPVGRIVTSVEPDCIRLIDIAVLSEHQGRGIGTAVLSSLFEDADASNRSVELTVWELNERAAQLYARLGFGRTGSAGGYLAMSRPARLATGVPA